MSGAPAWAATEVQHQQNPTAPEAERGAVDRSSFFVLVIDDDFIFREFVRGVLRKHGFDVLTAATGPVGLDLLNFAGRDIRIVLLDYNMPGFNGAETLQQVRRQNPSIKVVAVTVFKPQEVAQSYREGVDGYIEKPIEARELIRMLDALAGSSPQA